MEFHYFLNKTSNFSSCVLYNEYERSVITSRLNDCTNTLETELFGTKNWEICIQRNIMKQQNGEINCDDYSSVLFVTCFSTVYVHQMVINRTALI